MNDETKNELGALIEKPEVNLQTYTIGRILLQLTEEVSRVADAVQVAKDDYDPRFNR